MISQKYKKGMLIQDYAANVMHETGEAINKRQISIASNRVKQKSGRTKKSLQGRPFSVMRTVTGAKLVLRYQARIRFMDMKLSASGNLKKQRYAIYNKPIYGLVYGFAYSQLKYGLIQYLRENGINEMKEAFNESIEV